MINVKGTATVKNRGLCKRKRSSTGTAQLPLGEFMQQLLWICVQYTLH